MPFRIEYHFHAHVSCQFAPNIIFMRKFHAISHRISFSSASFRSFIVHRKSFLFGHFMPLCIEFPFYAHISCHCESNIIFMHTFHVRSQRISFSSASFMPLRIKHSFHAKVSCHCASNILFMQTFHAIADQI